MASSVAMSDAPAAGNPFDALPEDQRSRVLDAGTPASFEAGATIAGHGEADNRFYLIRSGSVRVERQGEQIATLGPGDFAGEFGASEWTASFGFSRTASLVAATSVDAVVIPGPRFNQLLDELPAFKEAVETTLRARMPTI